MYVNYRDITAQTNIMTFSETVYHSLGMVPMKIDVDRNKKTSHGAKNLFRGFSHNNCIAGRKWSTTLIFPAALKDHCASNEK